MKKWQKVKEKIKNFIYFKKDKRKKIIILVFLIILCFIFLIFSPFIFISQERADFLLWQEQYKTSSVCHEACLINRDKMEEKIINNWSNSKKLILDWKKYWQESLEYNNYDLQRALLSLALNTSSQEDFSLFLLDILASDQVEDQEKANIIKFFFASLNRSDLLPYYFSLLGVSNNNLQQAAILAISNLHNKKDILNISQIKKLENVVVSKDLSLQVRLDTLFLLLEYKSYFSEDIADSLINICDKTDNNLIKYFAIQNLISLGITNYELPKLSTEDLNYYFGL